MLDPKALAGMDAKMLASMGMDTEMHGLDSKLPQISSSSALINEQMLKSMGMDPKLLGFDPKMFAKLGPKLLSDPKLFAEMDPKMLLGGMDPRVDPKMFSSSSAGSSAAASPSSKYSLNSTCSFSTVPTSAASTQTNGIFLL